MTPGLSPNTRAILLLTAPLLAGRGAASADLLTPGEYKLLARHLRELQSQPADLVMPDAAALLRACKTVMEEARLQRLLGRGFLLSQVVERWQARAIWVVSRADEQYPRRLKARMREDAPAVLYGCGDISLLESGGLAVVGSRNADDVLINYTMEVGRLAARAGKMLVSGGARGIDQAAMRGALQAGGTASVVLADSLEKAAMNREHRNFLLNGELALISPYDPGARFHVGNAMQRNKLIYALADASLVVCADLKKGGTWAGASEQLDKLKFVPVYVRSTGALSPGLDALRQKGALAWPNPQDSDAFEHLRGGATLTLATPLQPPLLPLTGDTSPASPPSPDAPPVNMSPSEQGAPAPTAPSEPVAAVSSLPMAPESDAAARDAPAQTSVLPADRLFAAVRQEILLLVHAPMKEAEIAAALNVSNAQAKAWLQRLLDEGSIERQSKPTGFVTRQADLFRQAS